LGKLDDHRQNLLNEIGFKWKLIEKHHSNEKEKNNYDKCNDVIEKKKRKSKQIYDRSFKTKNGYNFGRR